MASSVLLVTSNGWGLGHLVRQLAIAKRIPPHVRCTILTLSQAAAVAPLPNLEYAPSYTQPWLQKGEWNGGYLRDRVVALAEEVAADCIVYDGVVVYPGLREAMTQLPAERIWMRRGLWRYNARTSALNASSWFDLILEPDDVGRPLDRGATAARHDAIRIGVVTDANPDKALTRTAAAAELGIDPQRPTLLINIGSSAIGDIGPIADALAEFPDWQILSTKDELGRSRELPNVKVLQDIFPLHPYLKAVDLAVSSVGYNAAHELVAMEVPTIFVPAPTTTDDQFARARAIADAGAGWAVVDQSPQTVARLLRQQMSADSERKAVSQACHALRVQWHDGAQEAADAICDSLQQPKRESLSQWLGLMWRTWLERRFGDSLRRKKRLVHTDFAMNRELTRELMSGELPFEHVLPRASSAYEARRREIAKRWLLG